jgi:putative hydrolase of the HAD superfamily
MIKHVWFDMGGTLFRETPEFDEAHDTLRYKAYAEIVNEPDIEKAKQGYMELYKKYGSNSAVFSSLGKQSDFWQLTFDNLDLASVLKPDPVISSTLEKLSNMIPISVFTNFKPEKIDNVLDILGIDKEFFTHMISGDDVTDRKPALEGFHKIIQLSGIPADQILYVGDRVDVDIKPAKAVGMQTCLLWQSSPEADYSTNDFAEILKFI